MKKKELFYKITDFTTLQNIGGGWVGLLKQYLPQSQWLDRSATLQIWLWALHINWIPIWAIAVFLAVKYYFMMWVNWYIGKKGIQKGLLEAQQQYIAKSEHISPVQSEMLQTIKNIANKVGAENKISKL